MDTLTRDLEHRTSSRRGRRLVGALLAAATFGSALSAAFPASAAAAATTPPAGTTRHVVWVANGTADITDIETSIIPDEHGTRAFGATYSPTSGLPKDTESFETYLDYRGTCKWQDFGTGDADVQYWTDCPNPFHRLPVHTTMTANAMDDAGTATIEGTWHPLAPPYRYTFDRWAGAKSSCVGDEAWVEALARVEPSTATSVRVRWEARLVEGDFDPWGPCGTYWNSSIGPIAGDVVETGSFEVPIAPAAESTTTRRISVSLSNPGNARATMSFDVKVAQFREACEGKVPTLYAESGVRTVGTSGADVILGTRGADVIDGQGGDDVICGKAGSDTIAGGTGNDRIFANEYLLGRTIPGPTTEEGGDTIDGGDGNDFLHAGQHRSTLANTLVTARGGAGDDTLIGNTAGSSAGLAHLYGDAGNDYLEGGPGGQALLGGDGDDSLYGNYRQNPTTGTDRDVLFGDAGSDRLMGGPDDDQLNGGPGGDVLDGGAGADLSAGGTGDDFLYTDAADSANGQDGCDSIDFAEECDFIGTVTANQPTVSSYSPSTFSLFRGGRPVIRRLATGRYEVGMPGLAADRNGASAQGVVHVAATGAPGAVSCAATNWVRQNADVVVNVECRTALRTPVMTDAAFVVHYLRPRSDATRQIGTVVNSDPLTPQFLGDASRQFNSLGGVNRIKRTAVGSYDVTFDGFTQAKRSVQVSAVGSTPRDCVVASYSASTATVRCTNADGLPADATWSLLSIDSYNGTDRVREAFTTVTDPTSATVTPNGAYSWNNLGGTITSKRLSTGRYQVVLPGHTVTSTSAVMVSAHGSSTGRCVPAGLSQVGTDVVVEVRCSASAGTAADRRFSIRYTA